MSRLIKEKRGQFVIIAALLIAALTLATTISIYEININRQSITYRPVDEFLLGTTSDMNRALTVALANYTDGIINQNLTEAEANLNASQFMTTWKESVLTSYSSYGLRINPNLPQNLIPRFDHNWNGNSTYSFAYIPYNFDVASYGFMGWVGSTEKYVQLQVYSATVNTQVSGQISLIFHLDQSDVNATTPISNLLSYPDSAVFRVGNYTVGNYTLGQAFSPPNNAPKLVYLGNGNYSLTFTQEQQIDPTTQVIRLDLATPNDGIWVSAYTPAPPKVTTLLSSDTIALGQSVSDSVNVAALDRTPSGNVTFWVSPDALTWTQFGSAVLLDSSSQAVSDSYTPPMPATYYFKANYSGDSNNLPSQSGPTKEPLTVQLATPTVTTNLPSTSITLGQPVHDTANVVGLGGGFPAPSGSVTFWVSSNGGSSWTQFGNSVPLVSGSATSADYTPLTAGNYYFQARYSGDSNYDIGSSGVTDELLTVSKVTPSVTTLLDATSITLGQTIHDTANVIGLGGSFPIPTGTATFYVSTDGGNTFTPFGGSMNLVSGSAISDDCIPMVATTLYFQARYSGDNNYNAAISGATVEPLTVGKAASTVTTQLFPLSITLGQSVSDTATVIGLGGSFPVSTGSVYFQVQFGSGSWSTFSTKTLNSAGQATSDAYTPSAAVSYLFRAIYSGDSNYLGSQSDDTAEPLTVGLATPGVSTLLSSPLGITLGQSVTDSATVTSTGGSVPTGTVTFYVSTDHINWNQFGVPENLDGFGKASSSSYTPSMVGTYYFMANYSGDTTNVAAHSGEIDEPLPVGKATPSVSTTLSSSSISLGQPVHDTAIVAGLGGSFPAATGSVTFWVSTNGGVSWTQFGGSVSLESGSATSADYTLLAAGTYYFQARYFGDGNYNAANSGATDEPLSVSVATPTVTTLLNATSITLSQGVHDTAIVAGLGGSFPAATGSVTFWVSTNGGVSWTQFGGSVSLESGSATSVDYRPLTAGNYYFQARYSGDNNYNAAVSGATDELLTVGKVAPTVTTRLSQTSITWGSSVTDTATVASLGNGFPIPSGNVDFYVSTDGGITWTKFDTKTFVSGSATSISYTPASFAPALSGTDYFKAVYLGDSNYVTASSGTNDEPLTVNSMNPGTLGTYYIDYIGGSGQNSFLTTTNPISPLGKVNPELNNGHPSMTVSSNNTVPTIVTTNPIYVTYVVKVKSGSSQPSMQTIQTQIDFSYNGHSYLIGTATFNAAASNGNPPPSYYTVTVALNPAFKDGLYGFPKQTIPAGSYIQLTTTLINPQNRVDLDGGIGGTRIIFF